MRWSHVANDVVDVDVEWIRCPECGFKNTAEDRCDCEIEES